MSISSLEGEKNEKNTHIFDLSVFSVLKGYYSKMFLCFHCRGPLGTSLDFRIFCSWLASLELMVGFWVLYDEPLFSGCSGPHSAFCNQLFQVCL